MLKLNSYMTLLKEKVKKNVQQLRPLVVEDNVNGYTNKKTNKGKL